MKASMVRHLLWAGRSVVTLSCLALVGTLLTTPGAASRTTTLPRPITNSSQPCPWVNESLHHLRSPSSLADEVVSKMTLAQKAGFVVLRSGYGIENFNAGVPSLCIPPLTLTDGPNGIAGSVPEVTQLPAAIGVAASFDPTLAYALGQLVGAEARSKGFDVVQGPDLNLARVPLSGRIFESYGEDPFLTGALAVANIKGIQSQGVMAMAKHFTAYTQENSRGRLDQIIPLRALAELYNAPFRAAVQQAHVASIMCAVGFVNSKRNCSNPYTYATLSSWGFDGFVRADSRAAPNVAASFNAGLAMIKPASASLLIHLIHDGKLSVASLNSAVRAVLEQMFLYGLVARPRSVDITAPATSPAHAATALRAAEESIVLLKNSSAVLPITPSVATVAVIGTDASSNLEASGGGSSRVLPPYIIKPLKAIRSSLGPRVRVSYAPGTPATYHLRPLKDYVHVSRRPLATRTVARVRSVARATNLDVARASNVTDAVATASRPASGRGWSHWRSVVRPAKSGLYVVAMRQFGDTWLYLNGRILIGSPGLHISALATATVHLSAGHPYAFSASWFSVIHNPPPTFGFVDATPQIQRAAALAAKSRVAIVFVNSFSTEGADRVNLNLTGDASALIAAVAAVNPRTVVVLNTGGPVVMPWLARVAAVLEAWYPGQEDGAAIAAVLNGSFDPSGRLPVTFPTSLAAQPLTSAPRFPGVNSVVSFSTRSNGLDVGYRWYQAHGVAPLFPFGFGLDYTTFRLSNPSLTRYGSSVAVRVTLTNTGSRSGADVVEIYVHYPPGSGEPPEQLRAFARVNLPASASRRVTLTLAPSSFQLFHHGTFVTMPGEYSIDLGASSGNLPLHLNVILP